MASSTKKKSKQANQEMGEIVVQMKDKNKKRKNVTEEIGGTKRRRKDRKNENDQHPKRSTSSRRKSKIPKSEDSTQTTTSLRKFKRSKIKERDSISSGSSQRGEKYKTSPTCMVNKLSRPKTSQNKRQENRYKSPLPLSIIPHSVSIDSDKSRGSTPSAHSSRAGSIRSMSAPGSKAVIVGKPVTVIPTLKSPLLARTSQMSSSRSIHAPTGPNYSPNSSRSHLSSRQNSTNLESKRNNGPIIVLNSQPTISNLSGKRSIISHSKKTKQVTGEELLKIYRDQVDRAIRERKTFTVCGNYWAVRRALLSRGWIEKVVLHFTQTDKDNIRKLTNMTLNDLIENVHDKTTGHIYKRVILSKMLGARHQVDLFWDYGTDAYKLNPDNVKLTMINNIRRGLYSYSTKNGLCELMKNSHWFHYPGVSHIRHPRSYSLTDNGDPEEFVRDFKITAAMSLLKWIVFTNENSVSKVMSETGKVPIRTFHFALKECDKFIQKFKHEDIDFVIQESMEIDWNQFLDSYYRCVHVGNHFKCCDLETEQSLVHKSKIMLNKLKKIWRYMDMDGYMNIWILKPTAGSRGIGIHICRTLAYVLRIVSERKTSKYVIQKYIERPLLIYNTKFDIRQWFLISSTSPLTIWIYKSCYLRFSSQTYNLRKLHESIHLTNNSVQCKYQNSNRDPGLPEYNMWDSNRFKSYLEMIGYPNVYDEVVYPGMKESITGAILIHQDYINPRKNCFELYGADFMLTEDFTPWLIEINSRPALHASTPITSKMCPQVLEDVVKVIVDRARSSGASTGQFELLYKEKTHPLPPLDSQGLHLEGIPLPQEFFYTPQEESLCSIQPEKLSSDIINISSTQNYMKYVSRQMKKTLENLLDIIQKERQRRQKLKSKRSSLTLQSNGKLPMDLEKDNIQYIENINRVNESIKEIQQIFKPKYLSDKKLTAIAKAIEGKETVISAKLQVEITEGEEPLTPQLRQRSLEQKTACSNVSLNKEKQKYYLPQQTDEQLIKESRKIEEALLKIDENNKSSTSYLVDFLRFLNIWGRKTAEKTTD